MIDWGKVEAELMVRAEVALRRAGEFTLGRARHHAPVRALFPRQRRGKAFTSQGPIDTASAYRAFRRSKERRRRLDIENAPPEADELRRLAISEQSGGIVQSRTRSAAANRRLSISMPWRTSGSDPRSARRLGAASGFSGHPNSLIPVFRQEGYTFTGDFRRFRTGVSVTQGGPTNMSERWAPDPVVINEEATMRMRNRRLTARGRYEFENASIRRGVTGVSGKKYALATMFNGRVGGRLRGEIHLSTPRWYGKTLWMYVVAPTPYATYQEFGTSRHRAQPFLRPALYESRKVLISEVNRVAKGAIVTRGAASGVVPGQPGPGV